jgi:hypothetical protein
MNKRLFFKVDLGGRTPNFDKWLLLKVAKTGVSMFPHGNVAMRLWAACEGKSLKLACSSITWLLIKCQ